MDWAEHPFKEKLVYFGVMLLIFNIIGLDIYFLNSFKRNTVEPQAVSVQPFMEPKPPDNSCPSSCIAAVREATSSAKPDTAKTANAVSSKAVDSTTGVKEYYIPVGTGSLYSVGDWGDVPGAQVYVDSGSYSGIKSVTFEASVHVADTSEDVYVRLYNDTDREPVWSSDLFFPSGTAIRTMASSPVNLNGGRKLYKVQMKTQFSTAAILDQSRIHIILR